MSSHEHSRTQVGRNRPLVRRACQQVASAAVRASCTPPDEIKTNAQVCAPVEGNVPTLSEQPHTGQHVAVESPPFTSPSKRKRDAECLGHEEKSSRMSKEKQLGSGSYLGQKDQECPRDRAQLVSEGLAKESTKKQRAFSDTHIENNQVQNMVNQSLC